MLSVTGKDVHGVPQPASDLFSQKCGWICSVPSVLSHWPPRPPSVYRLSDSWLRQGGHCVTIECTTTTGSKARDPGAFTSLALGSQLNIPVSLAHSEDNACDATVMLRICCFILQQPCRWGYLSVLMIEEAEVPKCVVNWPRATQPSDRTGNETSVSLIPEAQSTPTEKNPLPLLWGAIPTYLYSLGSFLPSCL